MRIDNLLNELKDGDVAVAPMESAAEMKVLINNDSSFKGRITKPVVITVRYKELAEALSEASGFSVNKMKAKAMFEAFRKTMGI